MNIRYEITITFKNYKCGYGAHLSLEYKRVYVWLISGSQNWEDGVVLKGSVIERLQHVGKSPEHDYWFISIREGWDRAGFGNMSLCWSLTKNKTKEKQLSGIAIAVRSTSHVRKVMGCSLYKKETYYFSAQPNNPEQSSLFSVNFWGFTSFSREILPWTEIHWAVHYSFRQP